MMVSYDIFFTATMIQNVFETSFREASDLVNVSVVFWVFVTGIAPSVLLLCTNIKYESFKKECLSRIIKSIIALLCIAVFAATSYDKYVSYRKDHRQIKGVINIYNFTDGLVRYLKRGPLEKVEFQELEKKPVNTDDDHVHTVLVFIVGETARAQSFSLNGHSKKTNPLLEKQDIVNFSNVSSCGTSTAVSLPCMFSHMPRKQFNNTKAQNTENVIDLLQKARFNVIWKDNDEGCKGVCVCVKNLQFMPRVKPRSPNCHGRYCWDDVLLEDLENDLKNIKQDTVIFLHTMGSHGPSYYKRYPDKFRVFKPTCDTVDIKGCSLEELRNTYDNTILYTDYIVSSAIDIVKKFPQYESGVIYLSDHGESLGENKVYLHARPYDIAPPEQTRVPMVLWMNSKMQKLDYINYGCLKEKAKRESFSHDNIFHSLLGLLEVKTSAYQKEYDIFSSCRTKP